MFTAMCGYRVDIIRRALREIRNVRYDGDYLIETIHEIDEKWTKILNEKAPNGAWIDGGGIDY